MTALLDALKTLATQEETPRDDERELFDRLALLWGASEIERVVRFLRRAVPGLADEEIVAALVEADWSLPLDHVIKHFLKRRQVFRLQ
jgi:hypothetical protein